MATIRKAFIDRLVFNKSWSIWLVTCEILNVFNVILQFYIIDVFLDHQFVNLGGKVIEDGLESSVTVLDEVFPKVSVNF